MREASLGVVGSFTLEPLARYTGRKEASAPALSLAYRFAGFGQIVQACRDPAGQFSGDRLDGIAVLWRVEDLFEGLLGRADQGDADALDQLLAEVEGLCREVEGLRGRTTGTLVFALPPLPRYAGFDPLGLVGGEHWCRPHREIVRTILRRFGGRADIRLLDLEAIVRHHGGGRAYDDRKWYLYRQPFSEEIYRSIGDQLCRLVASETTAAKKCIVVDCDNTLWGGIIGEDGLGGIQLGDTFPGRAFVDFQKELLALSRRGVFLAICSKNNEEDVAEVFDKHDAMILRRSDVSAFQVNWARKSANVEAIARQLNIGLDGIVFIDDSPVEIAEVGHALADVTCLLVPEEVSDLARILRESELFDNALSTREDAIRVASMQQERRRETARSGLSEGDYLASLGLRVTVFEAQDVHLDRITQLINKTNQFNLTTPRRSLAEVKAIATREGSGLYALDVKDRFGEYGLTGVAILDFERGVAELETLLMSCRVLNRGVEDAFLAALVEFARERGCATLRGTFRPTGKNQLVRDFFPTRGFVSCASGEGRWSRPTEDGYAPPRHIELVMRPSAAAGERRSAA